MAIITPERAAEIRGQLCEQHGAQWLHHYHEAIEAEVVRVQAEQDPVAYLFTDVQSGDVEVSVYEDEKPRSHWHRAPLVIRPVQRSITTAHP